MANGTVQRMTKQRQTILEELRKLHCHPTADELYEIVRERMPRISLGTIYRNLDVLQRGGDVLKLNINGGQSRFDGNTMRHHHIRCTKCGRVDDLPESSIGLSDSLTCSQNGYRVTGFQIEFKGICPPCQKSRA